MPIGDTWRVMMNRTALAAGVMGLIGALILFLLSSLPQYRDLWLILLGVLETGAVGVWRAEIDSFAREQDWRREVNLKRLDHTQTHVNRQVHYFYERSVAAVTGAPLPPLPHAPLLTEMNLAGDPDAIIAWHEATAPVSRTRAPITLQESAVLASAATRISSALQAQRMRLWRKQRPIVLTPQDEQRIQAAFDATLTR